jgi:hypothetical protein
MTGLNRLKNGRSDGLLQIQQYTFVLAKKDGLIHKVKKFFIKWKYQ